MENNGELLISVVFLVGVIIVALAFLGAIVFSILSDGECPKCHKYLALKTIARTKLEEYLYKYEYRCKYCNCEFERIEDRTPIIVP